MTNTRHEFAAVVHLAEQRDMVVGEMWLASRPSMACTKLPAEELEQLVRSLEENGPPRGRRRYWLSLGPVTGHRRRR